MGKKGPASTFVRVAGLGPTSDDGVTCQGSVAKTGDFHFGAETFRCQDRARPNEGMISANLGDFKDLDGSG